MRERRAPPVPAAATAAAVVFPRSNNSQGQRIRAAIIQTQNDQLMRRTTAARLRSLPATADVFFLVLWKELGIQI
jgi:hypothetical protein